MSRSGYSDDGDYLNLYRGSVDRAIGGKRGQAFLSGLARALDEMPVKRLIANELQDASGEVCAIGAYCKANNIDMANVDYEQPHKVADLVGVATCLAAEIEFENDERVSHYSYGEKGETPEERWTRMRKWVAENLKIKGNA